MGKQPESKGTTNTGEGSDRDQLLNFFTSKLVIVVLPIIVSLLTLTYTEFTGFLSRSREKEARQTTLNVEIASRLIQVNWLDGDQDRETYHQLLYAIASPIHLDMSHAVSSEFASRSLSSLLLELRALSDSKEEIDTALEASSEISRLCHAQCRIRGHHHKSDSGDIEDGHQSEGEEHVDVSEEIDTLKQLVQVIAEKTRLGNVP